MTKMEWEVRAPDTPAPRKQTGILDVGHASTAPYGDAIRTHRKVQRMRVFVSWSKPLSHDIAQLLSDWLPDVIQDVQTWISTEDIAKGQRWNAEISKALDQTSEGIFCVTRENVHEPWLNFEAGAIAKSIDEALVRPLLIDVAPHEITGPLAQFQATILTKEDDMRRLFESLNRSCPEPLKDELLGRAFNRTWDEYNDRALEIVRSRTDQVVTAQRADPRQI